MEFVFACADISLTFLISEEDDSDEEDLEGERASESEQEGFEVESSDGNSSNVEGDEGLPSVNTPRIDGMCVPRMHACTHAHARTHARTHTIRSDCYYLPYSILKSYSYIKPSSPTVRELVLSLMLLPFSLVRFRHNRCDDPCRTFSDKISEHECALF